jgi:ferredoxin
MRATIFLHSATGNTALVAQHSARVLRGRGHRCEVHDIVRDGEPPATLDDVDLVGVACPTMYFRPTFAMERFLARLPPRRRPGPAFLLATCMGEPGAHFEVAAELLRHKDLVTLGAHWVLAPSNWPLHVHGVRRTSRSTPVGTWLNDLVRPLRPVWGTIWPLSTLPDERDRAALDAFLGEVLAAAAAGRLDDAPAPGKLHRPLPSTSALGRLVAREQLARAIGLTVDHGRCSRCGTCAACCPVSAIELAEGSDPSFGPGCTACYACFNRCPEGAIGATATPAGAGRYPHPPRAMRELFGERT